MPTPPTDAANLAAWYKFNTGIISSGGLVSSWADQSGNGRIMSQTTGTNQPTKETDGSILFDGVDNWMATAAFTLDQPETIYISFRQVTWADTDYISDGGLVNGAAIAQRTTSPSIDLFAGVGPTAQNTNLPVNIYGVIAAVFNGAASSLKVNGTAATTGNAGAGNMTGFTLGSVANATQFSNIQVKEILIYSVAHNTATQDIVIGYLGGRRGSRIYGGEWRRNG